MTKRRLETLAVHAGQETPDFRNRCEAVPFTGHRHSYLRTPNMRRIYLP